MKKQILTIIASLLLYTSANAIEFGIGVSGSMALVSAKGTETESANTGAEGSVRDASVDATTGVGSIFAEVILDNGIKLYASQDYEGNGPGALFFTDKDKCYAI